MWAPASTRLAIFRELRAWHRLVALLELEQVVSFLASPDQNVLASH